MKKEPGSNSEKKYLVVSNKKDNDMRTFYLYKKISENGNSVKKLAENFISDGDAAFAVTEHNKRFDKLDISISKARSGDVLIIESLYDLGDNKDDLILRLNKIIEKRLVLLLCDFTGTFTHGISPDINNIILETIVDMLKTSSDDINIVLFKGQNVGRPSVTFPEGWEEKYYEWENGLISSSKFIEWSGMKKATFYNKITEYKELREQEERYKAEIRRIIS